MRMKQSRGDEYHEEDCYSRLPSTVIFLWKSLWLIMCNAGMYADHRLIHHQKKRFLLHALEGITFHQ